MHNVRPRRRTVRFRFIFLLLLAIVASAGTLLYIRPLPVIYATSSFVAPVTKSVSALTWPAGSEAAVGSVGYGVLATNGSQMPKPTASVAKVITALTVLKQHPLKLGEQGPTLTLDATDVAYYNQYAAEDGSVAAVQVGEQISEYQALQVMLLPSANNMADSLARWAYGTLPDYSSSANQIIRDWGMAYTTVGVDASGFDPSSVSTANDLVNLGIRAMQNPVLAQIVNKTQATDPIAGVLHNTNQLLGQDGIVGIKTGNTDQAGGVFLSATQETVGGQPITVVSAVVGAPDLGTAMLTSIPLLDSAKANFTSTTIAKAGTAVDTYTTPWGSTAAAVTKKDLSLITWNGSNPVKPIVSLNAIYTPLKTNAPVGSLTITSNANATSTPVILKQNLASPSWWWRIVRHKL